MDLMDLMDFFGESKSIQNPWGLICKSKSISNPWIMDLMDFKSRKSMIHNPSGSSGHVSRFGNGKGSSDKQLDNPRGLTISTDGYVFITEYRNRRIKILDQYLQFKRHVMHQSLRCPTNVKLTSNEMYVLCNSSPCVQVLSHAGEMKLWLKYLKISYHSNAGMCVHSKVFSYVFNQLHSFVAI